MPTIQFKTLLAACTLAAGLTISHSSQAQDCLKGDVNLDGTVNMADAMPMIDLVQSGEYLCEADNGDGSINFMDIVGIQQRILDRQAAAFTNTVTDGPGDFFWSTLNLGEGAVNGPIDLDLSPGESATLYLYYSTSGPSSTDLKIGYSVNVGTSQNGIVRFTAAETFNPSNAFGIARWGYPTVDAYNNVEAAPAQSVESNLIIGLTAMSLTGGTGLDEALSPNDAGYDSNAQAFLCGSVEIEAIAAGTIELTAGPNDVGIANEYALLQSGFAKANISVAGQVLLGDINGDDIVNFLDIRPFISLLATGFFQPEGDINGDGMVDFRDISPFIIFLSS